MIREITPDDEFILTGTDILWTKKQYWDLLTMPGCFGLIEGTAFVIGLDIGGEFFLERVSGRGWSHEDIWDQLRAKFTKIHVEFSLERSDHARAIKYWDAGFRKPEVCGPMRFRLTKSR